MRIRIHGTPAKNSVWKTITLTAAERPPAAEYEKKLLRWKDINDEEIKDSLDKTTELLFKIKERDWNKESLEKVLIPISEAGDRGKLLWPFRVALTGKEASAGPFEIAEILGKEKTLKRLKEAREL